MYLKIIYSEVIYDDFASFRFTGNLKKLFLVFIVFDHYIVLFILLLTEFFC